MNLCLLSSQDEAQIKYVINHDFHELGDWSKEMVDVFQPRQN
jgi:hypothetical protein